MRKNARVLLQHYFLEDGSISTRVSNHSMKLDDDLIGNILGVPMGGIRSIARKTCSVEFLKECSRFLTLVVLDF